MPPASRRSPPAGGFDLVYRLSQLLPPLDHRTGVRRHPPQPAHDRGVTPSPGLYFLGFPWLHTWGFGRFCGVADHADYLASLITERLQRRDASQERLECTALLRS
jgi:hypothetical protein